MSSTTGIQNFLVNVFRPVYTYDPLTTIYTVKLELSNIDTYSGNTVSVFTAAVGDSASNVYVGSNAGNVFTNIRACSNVVALGYGTANLISNVSNSTYLGNAAGAGAAGANAVIGIGTSAGGNGTSNIFIGNSTSATGNNNILIGHGITATSNTLRLGSTIYGNMSTNWIGIGTSTPYDVNDRLDVSGNTYILGQLGINITPGTRTLDVNGNFRASDSNGTLDFSNGVTTSTGGFGSIRSSITLPTGIDTIGTLKRGVVLVSAVDAANTANRASRLMFAYTSTAVTELGSNLASGSASITLSSSNIQISATVGATYNYSITYFPLP